MEDLLYGGTVVERTGGGEEVEREVRGEVVTGYLQVGLHPVTAHLLVDQSLTSPTSPDNKLSARSQHLRLRSQSRVNQLSTQQQLTVSCLLHSHLTALPSALSLSQPAYRHMGY